MARAAGIPAMRVEVGGLISSSRSIRLSHFWRSGQEYFGGFGIARKGK
ncbi:MAG: hypothetical protein P8Q29_01280 [Tateyamaria sp.]|nr:hypothetical protein [Tateyamaria sp.]